LLLAATFFATSVFRERKLFNGGFRLGNIIRFYSFVVRIGIGLALVGQLRSCTLTMMGLAAEKSGRGIISYSKFSRMLTEKQKGR
jgi:hypothetical protein